MRLQIPLVVLAFLFPFFIAGQSALDSLQKRHKDHLESLVLLKNEGHILPFKDLAKTSIAHLSIGDSEESLTFKKILKQYTSVKSYHFPLDANGVVGGEIFKYLVNYADVVIISINELVLPPYSAMIADFVSDLSKRVDVVYALFGSKDLIMGIPSIELAKAVLYSPKRTDLSQSLAAQICFGAVAATGRLKDTIATYKQGIGLITKGGLRLGFSEPELAGINGVFLREKLASIVKEGLDSMAFPGAQVLIAKNNQVIYNKEFGYHTYRKERKVQPEDLYDLASITKVTTAIPALMRMQDEGRFDIDAKWVAYFPDFKGTDKADLYFRPILAHHARLQPYIAFWAKTIKKNGKFRARTFKPKYSSRFPIKITNKLYLHKKYKRKMGKYIKESPLNKTPGYLYSGLSFLKYPDLVKAQTGKPFDRYLYDTFYKPIGANKLIFNPLQRENLENIVPTERDTFFRKMQVHGTVHDEAAAMLNGISGNAGLFGNATDLTKLLQLFLNNGSYGGEQFVEPSTVQEYTQCQFCDQGNRRGLGFDRPLIDYDPEQSYVARSASQYSYGHSGFTGTFFWVDPAEKLIVIFLSNRVYPTRANQKLYTMNIRSRLHQAVYDAIYAFDDLKEQEANKNGEVNGYDR